jgi:hypothetical protein
MLEHSRKVFECPDTPATPKAFDRFVVFGTPVLEQLVFAGEPEITRFAAVVALWRGTWARMSYTEPVRVEILLTVTAPEFRWPVWVMTGEPVHMQELILTKRPLAREAVEAFGYKQVNVGLRLLVLSHAV